VSAFDFLAFLALLLSAICAGLILWANPRRCANQAAFVFFILVSLWVICREISSQATSHALPLLRLTISIGSWAPAMLWICKESLTHDQWSDVLRKSRLVLFFSLFLSILPWMEWFIPSYSTKLTRLRGPGYYAYSVGALALYSVIYASIFRQMRQATGMARFEFKTISWIGTLAFGLILVRMTMDGYIPAPITRSSSLVIVVGMIGWATLTIFTHRVYDAQYLFRIAVRYALLISVVALDSYGVYWLGGGNLPAWLTFILMAVVSLAVARWLNGRLDRWLFQFPAAAAARAAAHGAARTATTAEELRQEFERVVSGWAHAEKALFAAVVPHEPVETTEWSLVADDPVLGTLREIHWATPERLRRERSTPGREAVRAFLAAHGLGAAVLGRGESVTVLMAVGLKPTRRPFTYPEIEQLIELAEIAEAALSRVRLTEQAVQREKLATLGLLGASLAHEIRNPLYAIRAFAELLPDNYDRTEFREQFAGMVGTEVVRIDQLISQLMNLAAPRKLSATTGKRDCAQRTIACTRTELRRSRCC
jgi:signal transduction histidine kinase